MLPEPSKIEISVNADTNGTPKVLVLSNLQTMASQEGSQTLSLNVVGYQNWALSMFLPESDPDRTEGPRGFSRDDVFGKALCRRTRASSCPTAFKRDSREPAGTGDCRQAPGG